MKRTTALLLCLTFVLLLSACGTPAGKTADPEDFSFSLTWGCYGDSTYDSKTGKLVKQKTATKVRDYTAAYFLTEDEKAELLRQITEMDPWSYPDEYAPLKGMTSPERKIVLTVTCGEKTKTVTCERCPLTDTPNGSKGKKFMKVHDTAVAILTGSDEWNSLPDYEFLYD